MIMNNAAECIESKPRFNFGQKVYTFDATNNKVVKGKIGNINFQHFDAFVYTVAIPKVGFGLMIGSDGESSYPCEYFCRDENQIFTDFNSCKIAAHATYLQKIKDLLEQIDE